MRRSLTRIPTLAVAALAASSLTLAACGSSSKSNASSSKSSTSSSKSSSSSSSSPGLQAAKAFVASHTTNPTTLPISKPVGKTIPTGKTVDIVNCGPSLQHGVGEIEAGAEAESGWVEHVNDRAQQTLYPQARSYYMGDELPGKPRVFMPYVGGVRGYRRILERVAANGYEGFQLRTAGEPRLAA